MAITRARKEELVAKYSDLLASTNGFVIVQAKGMSVKQTESLRKAVYEAQGEYVVAKNTLLRIALQEAGWTVPEELLKGPVAFVVGNQDFPGVAKSVLKYIEAEKLEEKAQVTGGVMQQDVLNTAQVKAISELPSLDELRAQLVGLIISPASGVVNAIHAATGQVVNVLQAYLDDRGEGEDAA